MKAQRYSELGSGFFMRLRRSQRHLLASTLLKKTHILRCDRLARIRVRGVVFVFVRNSRPRFHGHDHEDSASALTLFEQPAIRVSHQPATVICPSEDCIWTTYRYRRCHRLYLIARTRTPQASLDSSGCWLSFVNPSFCKLYALESGPMWRFEGTP